MEVEKMNIFQKMLAIQSEIKTVGKNLNVGIGQNSYKGVSEGDVLDAVRPLEEKYHIYSYPAKRIPMKTERVEGTDKYGKPRTTYTTEIKITYKFVNCDKPEEFIETESLSDGMDTQDKRFGKAMTYGDRYALMKMYKIRTGEDPEEIDARNAAKEAAEKEKADKAPAPRSSGTTKKAAAPKATNNTPEPQAQPVAPNNANVGPSFSAANAKTINALIENIKKACACSTDMVIQKIETNIGKQYQTMTDMDVPAILGYLSAACDKLRKLEAKA